MSDWRSSLERRPPSEKESGVMLRMAIMWVERVDWRARMGGSMGAKGVMVDIGDEEGGSWLR